LGVRCTDFPEESIPDRFGAFLNTVPFSSTRPGFMSLTIRAVDFTEQPILEEDLRSSPLDPAGIASIIAEQLHSDCSYETSAFWDLATFDAIAGKQVVEPCALEIMCRGEDFENGIWKERGHIEVDLGFEHYFTGHARLLGIRGGAKAAPQSPEEARFLEAMAWPENLEKYQTKTRENIRKLLEWTRQIEKAIVAERIWLWSEGEENFEARLEEIVAAR
jgi:hypothetical protein